ncbi:IS110 family transposase [Mangrovicoccus ximenensis]|uniref:IS110 family transposase n=1 Tax=Mangrovicoccus ximenensis TaxID=1911570 RepID=UPI001EFFFFB8|nr:transposase [Mangrovicoccus ximenensis]
MEDIIIGVDTHKADDHAAVAINAHGARLGTTTIPATRRGYCEVEAWAADLGPVKAFGIEGTGSDGAGLSRELPAAGHIVLDVMRPNRQLRYLHGKSDSLDAESAARSLLNGQAESGPGRDTGTAGLRMEDRHVSGLSSPKEAPGHRPAWIHRGKFGGSSGGKRPGHGSSTARPRCRAALAGRRVPDPARRPAACTIPTARRQSCACAGQKRPGPASLRTGDPAAVSCPACPGVTPALSPAGRGRAPRVRSGPAPDGRPRRRPDGRRSPARARFRPAAPARRRG